MYLRGRACSAAAAAIDRYLLRTRAPPQQQTCWPTLLLSVDGTDSRFVTLTAYYTYVYRAVTLTTHTRLDTITSTRQINANADYSTLIGSLPSKAQSTDQRDRLATRSGQNTIQAEKSFVVNILKIK